MTSVCFFSATFGCSIRLTASVCSLHIYLQIFCRKTLLRLKVLLRVELTIYKVKTLCTTHSLCRYWQGDTRVHAAAAAFFMFLGIGLIWQWIGLIWQSAPTQLSYCIILKIVKIFSFFLVLSTISQNEFALF